VSHAQKVIAGVGTDLAKLGDGGYDKGARARQIHDDLLRLRAPTQKDMLEIQLDDRAVFLERWHNQLRSALSSPEALSNRERVEFRRRLGTGRAAPRWGPSPIGWSESIEKRLPAIARKSHERFGS